MAFLGERGSRPFRRLACAAMLVLSASLISPGTLHAERIKELASIRGVNSNALIGYGLVVGLAGTGDNLQSVQTQQMVANMLTRRFGTVIDPKDVKAQNVAVVMVTARLPQFSRIGQRIDITVSSSSNAKSLMGGTLLPTAMKAGNGHVFAWAEGALSIGGFSASGGSGSSVTRNHPTVGAIPDGAVVAKELSYRLDPNKPITIALKRPDFTTAARMAHAINRRLGAPLASASDPGTIQVVVPKSERTNLVGLIASIENIEVTPDSKARVLINERTGTVVMGAGVRLAPVAISHGSLTVQIDETKSVSQPSTFSTGDTVMVPQTEIEVIEEGGDIHVLDPGPTLGQVVYALNTLGVGPRDLVAILLALKAAGALQAEVEVR